MGIDWSKPVPKFGRIALVVGVLVGGAYYLVNGKSGDGNAQASPAPSSSSSNSVLSRVFNTSKPLTVCTNTWGGYAPGYYYNGGANPSKNSRFYKEQGVEVGFVNIDAMGDSRSAWVSDQCQVLWITADSFPTESDGLKDHRPKIFLQWDWSRKGDVIWAQQHVRSVQDLRGKKVAAAKGSPSTTLLAKALEAGNLKFTDIEFIGTESASQAAEMGKGRKVDVAVVWSPDDGDMLKAVPGSHILMHTGDVPYAIADVFYAKESVVRARFNDLVGFTAGWLTAAGELNNSLSARKQAARIMAEAWKQDLGFMELAVENVRFATYGDNLNFFEMEGATRGSVNGEELYDSMSSVFAELNLAPPNVPSWRTVTDTSVLEAVGKKMNATGLQAAEGSFKFSAPTPAEASAPALASKPLPVNFATDSAELDLAAKTIIDKNFAGVAKTFASLRLRVEGNTDNTGSAARNRTLSKQRADSAADYLVRKYGFDPDRIVAVGNGPDKPVASNETSDGRAANRRTEFEVLR